jgi:hypothetical protein
LRRSGRWADREQRRIESQFEAALQQALLQRFHAHLSERRYNEIRRQVFEKRLSPAEGVGVLLDEEMGADRRGDSGAASPDVGGRRTST